MPVAVATGALLISLHIWLLKTHAKNTMLLLGTLYSFCLMLEFFTYLLICFEIIRPDFYSLNGNNFGAANQPYVRFDSISGYKYIPGKPRIVKVQDGTLVYDHILSVNNRGYCSVFDFPYKKAGKSKKRLIVFGDSFSAGEITDTTWVDLLNIKMAGSAKSIELFNFGLEATGISGWHNTFFKEIVPNYEFDGIVIANFGDLDYYSSDMARPFVIKHSLTDHSTIGFVEALPKNTDDFTKNYLSRSYYESSIYTPEDIDHYKLLAMHQPGTKRTFKWRAPHLYLLNLLSDAISFIREYNAMKKKYIKKPIDPEIQKQEVTDWKNFEIYYGKRATLTKEILDYCVANKKEIYFISIPSFDLTETDSLNYHNNIYNRQLKFLANKYKGSFFDGYNMMDSIPREKDADFHLYGDSHWSRKGIDRFIKCLPLSFFEQTH